MSQIICTGESMWEETLFYIVILEEKYQIYKFYIHKAYQQGVLLLDFVT